MNSNYTKRIQHEIISLMPNYVQLKSLIALLAVTLLAGCTTFSKDAGFNAVSDYVKKRSAHTPVWLHAQNNTDQTQLSVNEMLSTTLSADNAVRIALINNPNLQGSLELLNIQEADLVQAGKMRNPSLSYLKLSPVADEYDVESKVIFDIASLITIPLRKAIEQQRFEQAKLQAAMDILELIAKTQKAYYNLIGAQQTVHYLEKVKETAQISATLAKDLAKAGNWSKLQQAREQAFYLNILSREKKAKIQAAKERENLIRLLGLDSNKVHLKLPERLPDLPNNIEEINHIEKMALNNRLDIQIMKHDVQGKAKALKLTKATRFINLLDVGLAYNSSDSVPDQKGYEIGIEIPLFDWGNAKITKAQSLYMQSVWQLRDKAIQACSQIREQYQIYHLAYDIAKQYQDEIVPNYKRILDEDMLRYNGMLLSTFDIIADKREQITSINEYIQALRDFWIAQTDLQTALMVSSPTSS